MYADYYVRPDDGLSSLLPVPTFVNTYSFSCSISGFSYSSKIVRLCLFIWTLSFGIKSSLILLVPSSSLLVLVARSVQCKSRSMEGTSPGGVSIIHLGDCQMVKVPSIVP